MVYVFCGFIAGLLATLAQGILGFELLSKGWWIVGIPYWFLGGLTCWVINNV